MDAPTFDPRPIHQLDARPEAPTADWLWHSYLARGNVTLLTSRWKAGKTTLLAGLLHALGGGTPFLGRPCAPAAAVVVTEESERHWKDRCRAVPLGPHARFLCRPFPRRPTPREWDALARHAQSHRQAGALDLLVVDPLASFLPGRSDSDPATLFDLLDPLRRLAQAGAAVLVLHHPRKARADEGSTARGSGALLGFVDVALELHACGGLACDANRRRLVGLSRLADTPQQVVYEWTPGTADFRLIDDPTLERFRANWEQVRAILAGRRQPATHQELLADWPADRVPPSASMLYQWLGRATAEGWVQRLGGGTRTDPYRFRLPPPPIDLSDPDPLPLEPLEPLYPRTR
jgi:hypothetical protein